MADADVARLTGSPVHKHDITGVVLAGGRGSRMGGVDKGLQPLDLEPLALHALRRLKPQCGAMLISANRSPRSTPSLACRSRQR